MTPAGEVTTPGGGRPGRGDRGAVGRSTPAAMAGGVVLVGLVAVALWLLAGGAAATVPDGAFDSHDVAPPELGNVSKVDATTVELEVTDDTDVNESSVDVADFNVSEGAIAGVSAAERNDTDAVVTIDLESPIDTDRLRVSLADDATVSDAAGNEMDPEGTLGRTLFDMDGVAPTVSRFDADSPDGRNVEMSFDASEGIDGLEVVFDGPENVTYDREDFSSPVGADRYEATVQPPASGQYLVYLATVTDGAGNTRETNHTDAVSVDVTPPTAVARIDYAASDGLAVTLSADQSIDDGEIANVTWTLGDGSTATGERVTHEYDAANYTVNLSVRDAAGNVGYDQLLLNLTDRKLSVTRAGNNSAHGGIRIQGGGADRPAAMVDVTGARASRPVRIIRSDGAPVADEDGTTLEGLTVTLATNTSYGFAVQAETAADVADVRAATNGTALGGLTVVHVVADRNVANVTFDVGVARERVDDAIDDPDAVALFRYHNATWHRLETERTDGTEDAYRYRARSPGLSRFAIATVPSEAAADGGATNEAAPDAAAVAVTNAGLNATVVAPNASVLVTATLENRGNAAANVTAGLVVDGAVVDSQSLAVPPDRQRSISFTRDAPGEPGTYAVRVNDTEAGTLTVEGDADDGALFGFLGFLPLGLLQTVLTYVGGLVAAVFLLLKALALYLGY